VDGGIRSGQDVLKSLALGAKGTYIGRSYIYGLGAMGQKGVRLSLEIIQKELETTMALCGHRSLDQLSRDTLMIPADFCGDWA
jgi:L-lactate dehydrogenase (cytochrome)